MAGETLLTVDINGEISTVTVPAWRILSDFLRDQMNLKGTRVGCNEGVCGSCTVLLDGQPVRSCLTLALQADGRKISTVEGFAADPLSRDLQQAFVDHHAAQCGFCTSGVLSVARAFLEDDSVADHANDSEIRERLNAVICRCTGYQPIVAAVQSVARRRRGNDHD